MKFTSFKSLFVATCTLFALTQPLQAIEDRVVATVDGQPILQSQVNKALGKRKNTEANRRAATDDLISDILVQRAIQQSGIKINNAYVDQVIEDMVVKNGITYGQFLDYLDSQGISLNQYRQQLSHQILMDSVKQQTLSQSIQVDPAEVEQLANQLMNDAHAKGKLNTIVAPQHRVSHILIKTNPVLNDAQAKAKLNEIITNIQAGQTTFEDAAKANSLDYASGAEGGDLGWNFLDAYDPAFAKTAQKSKVGVISAPFKSQFGWHILKVTDTRQADRTQDTYYQRAYQQLMDQKAQHASKNWVNTLKSRAEIKYY